MNIKFNFFRFIFKSSVSKRKLSVKSSPVPLSFSAFHPTTLTCYPDAPPIVIMHGLLGSKRNWKSLGKLISDNSGRTVYTVDARNHGDSPFTQEMSYYDLSRDILHFMNDLSIEKASLIGHSMGGRAVMAVALQNPEVIEKLFVLDVSPITKSLNLSWLPRFFDLMLNTTIPQNFTLREARKHLDKIIQPLVSESFLRSFLLTNLVEENGVIKWKVNLKSLAENLHPHINGFPPADDGRIFDGETYFIGGQLSDYIKYSDHNEIRVLFPQAKFYYVEGAGHWLHAEKPQLFLDILIPLFSPS